MSTRTASIIVALAWAVGWHSHALAGSRGELHESLAAFDFLVGDCWTARFPDGRTTDTHCFEPVHDGRQLRDRHVVRGAGEPYSGETLYLWEPARGAIIYRYVDSTGGHSDGHVEARDGLLRFPADLYVAADGRRLSLVTEWQRHGEHAYRMLARQRVGDESRVMLDLLFERDPRIRSDVVTEADGSRTLLTAAVVDASLEELWRAFTTAEGWSTWAVPWVRMDFRLGGPIETSYRLDATAGDSRNIQNRILAFVPQRMLAFQAVQAPPGFPQADLLPRVHNVAEFERLASNRSRVVLRSVGYPPGAAGDELLGFFERGNFQTLQQLEQRFRTGPIDWAARRSQAPSARPAGP